MISGVGMYDEVGKCLYYNIESWLKNDTHTIYSGDEILNYLYL